MEFPQVVRIFATAQVPDYECPWQAGAPESSTGSGVLVAPGRVLTGAHVVAHATFLQVQLISDPDKWIARIEAICHDADLALLAVDKAGFAAGVEPVELGDLPDHGDAVAVVGYPVGGEEISVTEGVVSRVEVQQYDHSQRALLAVTVDAAINSGNSGGPVFLDDEVVGIAFQSLNDAENIGELVPAPLIKHFLGGLSRGPVLQLPALGIRTQNLENPTLRETLGLGPEDRGVLIARVECGGSAWGQLQPGDVVCQIDGLDVANNGTVRYRERFRTAFDVVLGDHYVGDQLPLVVHRDGKRKALQLTLAPPADLIPRARFIDHPRYFIFGGLVFEQLCRDFLTTWDRWWEKAPSEFVHLYYSGSSTPDRREIVVLGEVLADAVNVGLQELAHMALATIDGEPVVNFAQLVQRLDAAAAGSIVNLVTTDGSVLPLKVDACREANTRILERYRIPSDRSLNLQTL